MARSLWSGSVSFGLVNIPVRLFTAQRDHEISFHQLHDSTGNRVRYRKVDEETGEELDRDEIVKGYEVDKGQWVTFTADELDELRPASTRTLDIEDFVDLAEIDPVYYERTYYLAPSDDAGAARAYSLLLRAMKDRQRAGIGKVVIRNKQYLAAIRPYGKVLALSTMRFADEVVDPADVEDLQVKSKKPDGRSLDLATSLIDSLAGTFEPEKYHDTYTEELERLIEAKAKGETVQPEAAREQAGTVTDLMAALEQSVESAKAAGRGASRRRSARKKKAA